MAEPYSILHFNEGYGRDKYLSSEGNRRVAQYLREQGVEPVVVRGNEGWDITSGLVVPNRIITTIEGDSTHVVTEPFDGPIEYGATSIRDYSYVPVGEEVEASGANVINPLEIRRLDEKNLAFELLGDLQPLTVVVEPDKFIQQLGDIKTDEVVLKPVQSEDSHGLLMASKADLLNPEKYRLERREDGIHLLGETNPPVDIHLDRKKGYLLQETINTRAPFPAGIHVIDSCMADYQANIHNPKEVRLMLYWDQTRADKQIVVPYARTFTPHGHNEVRDRTTHSDNWLLLDIEKGLPQDLDGLTQDVAARILKVGDTRYFHGAFDVAFDGHRWYMMELNMWFPTPPSYKLAREKGAERLADIHRQSIADLMADTAKDAHGAKNTENTQVGRRLHLDT